MGGVHAGSMSSSRHGPPGHRPRPTSFGQVISTSPRMARTHSLGLRHHLRGSYLPTAREPRAHDRVRPADRSSQDAGIWAGGLRRRGSYAAGAAARGTATVESRLSLAPLAISQAHARRTAMVAAVSSTYSGTPRFLRYGRRVARSGWSGWSLSAWFGRSVGFSYSPAVTSAAIAKEDAAAWRLSPSLHGYSLRARCSGALCWPRRPLQGRDRVAVAAPTCGPASPSRLCRMPGPGAIAAPAGGNMLAD